MQSFAAASCGLSRQPTGHRVASNTWQQPQPHGTTCSTNSSTKPTAASTGRWTLPGNPADTKKQFYALGFAIYGLSEYARATGDERALREAIGLFRAIEEHSYDAVNNGYEEAAARDWSPIDDVRLSDKDANEKKTMNTHLHILEAYTNLLLHLADEGCAGRPATCWKSSSRGSCSRKTATWDYFSTTDGS